MEEILIVAACLILNALLACFEMAFVTVTKVQLRQLAHAGKRSAGYILSLRENPERTLSIIQIGITLVGMISAAVGGAGAEESFAPHFERTFGISENMAEAIAIIVVVLPLTMLSVVLGELVPKAVALRYPIKVSLLGARWIALADRLFSPAVSVFEKATKLVLSLLPKQRPEQALSAEPVPIDHLSKPTQQYVLNLVGAENKRIRDVKLPWENVKYVKVSTAKEEVAAAVISSAHTRLPVVLEGKVVGILHTKEFIALMATGAESWQQIVRPAIETRDEEYVLTVLRQMQAKRSHLAIVLGPDRQPTGIVTFEDIIEEIIGDLFDEDDDGRIRMLLSSYAKMRR